MVTTGKRAEQLSLLLRATGLGLAPPPPRPTLDDFGDTAPELLTIYKALGGIQSAPTFRPGGWDLSFDGLLVELDEELHFNRYRQRTLAASWASELPWTADFSRYCSDHEADCLGAGQWGKRWTNPSASRMFDGGDVGDLNGAGAPRWKQRALYDSMKDAAPQVLAVPVSRVATHDQLGGVTLGDVLDGRASVDPLEVRTLVDSRSAVPLWAVTSSEATAPVLETAEPRPLRR